MKVRFDIEGGDRPGFRRNARVLELDVPEESAPNERKQVKKVRLRIAKEGFSYPIDLKKLGCTRAEAQEWLFKQRCRSWKQKGMEGDYFVKTWNVIWFANPDLAMRFKLALFRK